MEMKVYYNQIERKKKRQRDYTVRRYKYTFDIQKQRLESTWSSFQENKKYKQEPNGLKYLKTNTHTEIRRNLTK